MDKFPDESALREAFQRTTPKRSIDFAEAAIEGAIHDRAISKRAISEHLPSNTRRHLLPLPILTGLCVLLFSMLLSPVTEPGAPETARSLAPSHIPSLPPSLAPSLPPYQVPPICAEVRRKDLERRLQRQRQRLKPRTLRLPS